jgi:hypothetical protein
LLYTYPDFTKSGIHILKYFFYKCLDIFIVVIFSPTKKYHRRILLIYSNIFLNIFFINVWISSSSSYIFADQKNIIVECCYILHILLNIFFMNVWISSSSSYIFADQKNIIVEYCYILNIFLNIFFYKCSDIFINIIYFPPIKNKVILFAIYSTYS